jgi:hypothetical protein
MALKRLTVAEMIQLSTPWLTVGNAARTLLDRFPLLTAMLPKLQAAHSGIFAVRAQAEDPKVQRLSQPEAELEHLAPEHPLGRTNIANAFEQPFELPLRPARPRRRGP